MAAIESDDGRSGTVVRTFHYHTAADAARSSGVVLREPAYGYWYDDGSCSYYSRSSVSLAPLGLAQGSPVGYGEVEVRHGAGGEGGVARHHFRTAAEAPDGGVLYERWPFATRTSYDWKRGQRTRRAELRLRQTAEGVVREPVRETATAYAFRDEDGDAAGAATTQAFRALSLKAFAGASGRPAYAYNPYEVISAWVHPRSEAVTTYDPATGDSATTTTTYTYEERAGEPALGQLRGRTETNTTGEQRTTEYLYAHERHAGMQKGEGQAHMLSQRYRTTVRAGGASGTVESRSWTAWDNSTGRWRPASEWAWEGEAAAPEDHSGAGTVKQAEYVSYDEYGRPKTVEDALGHATTFAYEGTGAPTTNSDAYLLGVEKGGLSVGYGYDALGRLRRATGEDGHRTCYDYDGLGRLSATRHLPAGSGDCLNEGAGTKLATYAYDYAGADVGADPNAVRTSLYGGESPDREAVAFFDGLGRAIQAQEKDRGGEWVVTRTDYDAQGRPAKAWRPFRAATGGAFLGAAQVRSAAEALYGTSEPYAETRYEASPLARPIEVVHPGGAATTTTEYGVEGDLLVVRMTGETGRVAESYSDGWGRTRRAVAGVGTAEAAATAFAYDVLDRNEEVTSPMGLLTAYDYDALGRLIQKTSPDAGTTRYAYDDAGQLRFSQDARQDAEGEVAFTTYDFAGRPLTTGVAPFAGAFDGLDASGEGFEGEEAHWRQVRRYDAAPGAGAFPWDRAGAAGPFSVALRDGTNLVSVPVAAPDNHYLAVFPTATEPPLERVGGAYQADETLEAGKGYWVTSSAATVQAFSGAEVPSLTLDLVKGWNMIGAPSCTVALGDIGDPSGVLMPNTLYRHDGRYVRATTVEPGRGYLVKASASGPITLDCATAAPVTGANLEGRLAAVATRSGKGAEAAWQEERYSYDTEGRLALKAIRTEGLPGLATEIDYELDRQGALLGRGVSVAGRPFRHWYGYDGRGLLQTVKASASGTEPSAAGAAYDYWPDGQVRTRQFEGGDPVEHAYTVRGWIERIGALGAASAGQLPFAAAYDYFDDGNVREAAFANGALDPARYRYRYGYDDLGRLQSADFDNWSGSGYAGAASYDVTGLAYDRNGNLTALQRRDEAGALVDALGYAYASGTNRLSGVTDAVAETEATWDAETGTFDHDANGNMTSLELGGALSLTATYDETNRPVEVVRSDIAAPIRYRYAADGRRYYEEWSGNVTYHVLDGSSSLGVFGRDPYTGVWIPVTWNVVAPSGQAVGREEGRPGLAGARVYYHTDHLGSVRAGVGPPSGQAGAGTTVWEAKDYYPFGLRMPSRRVVGVVGSLEDYTGHEYDGETGWIYAGARYYMPSLGRWTSVDPLADLPVQIDKSPYAYAWNDPINLFDPDGRCPCAAAPFLVKAVAAAKAFFSGAAVAKGTLATAGVVGAAWGISEGDPPHRPRHERAAAGAAGPRRRRPDGVPRRDGAGHAEPGDARRDSGGGIGDRDPQPTDVGRPECHDCIGL